MTQQVPGEPRHEADGPISVERLIGPAGPELGCEECFRQLDAYVELELAGGSAGTAMPAMDAHLVGCPACRDDRDSLLAFLLADPPDSGNGNGGLLASRNGSKGAGWPDSPVDLRRAGSTALLTSSPPKRVVKKVNFFGRKICVG